jgi:hypothetical protein
MIPPFILRIRERNCAGCGCEVDKADPCSACPKRKWGPFSCQGAGFAPGDGSVSGLVPGGSGPGTRLKALLARLGLKSMGGCRCNARAREMDRRGAGWCRDNMDTIVGWLREEAKARGLPFVAPAARLLVRLALRGE